MTGLIHPLHTDSSLKPPVIFHVFKPLFTISSKILLLQKRDLLPETIMNVYLGLLKNAFPNMTIPAKLFTIYFFRNLESLKSVNLQWF